MLAIQKDKGRNFKPKIELFSINTKYDEKQYNRNNRTIHILAKTIYGEAKNENVLIKEAIGHVAINRYKQINIDNELKLSLDQICLDPEIFKCWNGKNLISNNLFSVNMTDENFATCNRIARKIYFGLIKDPTYNSTKYHKIDEYPKWSLTKAPNVEIGNFLFYK